MKYSVILFSFVFEVFMPSPELLAQQSVLTSNNDVTGIQGSVSYSVGQSFFLIKTGTNGSVSEGIQQPYEISDLTGLDEEPGITLECMVYPNPFNAFVILKISNQKTRNLTCNIYGMDGLLLKSMIIECEETRLPLKDLVPAIYFLTITENNQILRSFRVIKK